MQDTSEAAELRNGSTAEGSADVFCASCFSAVGDQLESCTTCGVALTAGADPRATKHVRDDRAPHRASGRVPSLMMVIGMWIILLPGLFGAFGMGMGPAEGRIRARILVGLVFWAYGSVLYKITSRYLEAKRS